MKKHTCCHDADGHVNSNYGRHVGKFSQIVERGEARRSAKIALRRSLQPITFQLALSHTIKFSIFLSNLYEKNNVNTPQNMFVGWRSMCAMDAGTSSHSSEIHLHFGAKIRRRHHLDTRDRFQLVLGSKLWGFRVVLGRSRGRVRARLAPAIFDSGRTSMGAELRKCAPNELFFHIYLFSLLSHWCFLETGLEHCRICAVFFRIFAVVSRLFLGIALFSSADKSTIEPGDENCFVQYFFYIDSVYVN